MIDDVAGLIRELSGILQRISQQGEVGDRPNAASQAPEDKNLQFTESPLEALHQHTRALDSLIERLKKRPKKG